MIETKPARAAKRRDVEAEIQWLSAAQGGRKHPPLGPRYRSLPRFLTDPNGMLGNWSVEIVFIKTPTERTKMSVGTMSFISKDAPQQLLKSGARFELTEGRKIIALGEIK